MVTRMGRGTYKPANEMNKRVSTTQKFSRFGDKKFEISPQKFKPRKTKFNPNVSYSYCGKTRHVHDDCYMLIGSQMILSSQNQKSSKVQLKVI